MPKKKKKKPVVSAKVQQAQKFNDFKKRLLLIAKACDALEEFKLLPKRDIEFMFSTRFKPFDIVPAQGQQLSPSNYRILKQIVNYLLKKETITFVENGEEVNLYEYYYVGDSLRSCINDLKDEKFKGATEIIKAFKPLSDKHDSPNGPHDHLFDISNLMASLFSRVNKGYWLFHYHLVNRTKPFPEFRTCFKVEFVAPEIIHIVENGNKRPAFRVGWTIYGQKISWAQITPKQLNIKSAFNDLKIDVYIQSHAIIRMKERLDCIPENLHHNILSQSIKRWETSTNNRAQTLIAYKFGDTKLGYLVYEYNQGVVLIKTFLLLTNNGTPESEKLNMLLGLEKSDKKYLNMDKLSHFVKSDIPNNKELYDHFKDAGCDCLFDVNEKIINQNTNENIHAALIEEYINSVDNEE